MRIVRSLRTAFQSPVSDLELRDHEEVKREIARGVVRQTATGNVNLLQGRYLTREDMDQNREEAKEYKVDDARDNATSTYSKADRIVSRSRKAPPRSLNCDGQNCPTLTWQAD